MKKTPMIAEFQRLAESEARQADWKNWGPYVSERAWGTVREDYSPHGTPWEFFPFDHAHARAYRWNEDGLAGVCNRFQNLCFSIGLWNHHDSILKERLFGLSNHEGNHGEDVKEYYFHVDNVPTHSYMKFLYKYPLVEFPYERLRRENAQRSRDEPEYELIDCLGEEFRNGLYFDVFVEYAKADPEDLLCRVTAHNRSDREAPLDVLLQLWFRNTWSWGYTSPRHLIKAEGPTAASTFHRRLGERWLYLDAAPVQPRLLFTENDTNFERIFGSPNKVAYVKDGFNDAVVEGRWDRVNPEMQGSKCGGLYRLVVPAGRSIQVRGRFAPGKLDAPFEDFDKIFAKRNEQADEFHKQVAPPGLDPELESVFRQALAGLMWSKQFYHYSVELWQNGDPAGPAPAEERVGIRNKGWKHLYNLDVLAMPDKWEYPWYASWDLAFHCVSIALIDPEWAKRQIILLMREWYMHPAGQLPSYEWNLDAVNPPVHAWAALRVYQIERDRTGKADVEFLEESFHKLLLNFTWWVNKQDSSYKNIFQGGFLGLDNIGVFDRNQDIPNGGELEQADGTAWMGMYCLNMFDIAVELAETRPAYESVATKFFEHFISIAAAINGGSGGIGLWDAEDGFYYDVIHFPNADPVRLRVRSFVGLIPLFAVATLDPGRLEKLPQCLRRIRWFVKYRPGLVSHVSSLTTQGEGGRYLLSILDRDKLEKVLSSAFDPSRFLSEFGLRSLSKRHETHPFELDCGGVLHTVRYEPGDSRTAQFGGNSNWRGPVWAPVNFLMIESLRKYHLYYGDSFRIEHPHGSGKSINLSQAADELARRLVRLFLPDPARGGARPSLAANPLFHNDPHWRNCINFYEYFHGDDGRGLAQATRPDGPRSSPT